MNTEAPEAPERRHSGLPILLFAIVLVAVLTTIILIGVRG